MLALGYFLYGFVIWYAIGLLGSLLAEIKMGQESPGMWELWPDLAHDLTMAVAGPINLYVVIVKFYVKQEPRL